MSQRRYDENEVAAIFQQASEAQLTGQRQVPLASSEGMTLRDLQEIGREVGIDPQLVAHAAQAMERKGRPTFRRFLGLPIGVGRTVELGRKLSDDEWDQLVVDLRETFDARGRIRHEGSFRQWTNGNLQALLEPTATGHRLRLRTFKGDAVGWITGGIGMIAVSAVMFVAAAVRGGIGDIGALSGMSFVGVIGAVMFSLGALRLPGWARLRQRQMESIASRLALTAGQSDAGTA